MFRYSLVYAVKNANHPLRKCIRKYASELDLNDFTPHVTIAHSLSFERATDLFEIFSHKYDLPEFRPLPSVKVTSTPLTTTNGKKIFFYAVEQSVLTNEQQVMNMHVSLAYKVGEPFTHTELAFIQPYEGVLPPEELTLCVHSCHSKSPSLWRTVR